MAQDHETKPHQTQTIGALLRSTPMPQQQEFLNILYSLVPPYSQIVRQLRRILIGI